MHSSLSPDGNDTHCFDTNILREYDIRGVAGINLFSKDAYFVGRAYGAYFRQNKIDASRGIAVAWDGRLSSPELETALIDGLQDAGLNIIKLGLGPTPMLYFAVHHFGFSGGIMVTGSHNPPDHNGFKILAGKRVLYGKDIQTLGELAKAGLAKAPLKGEVTTQSILHAYVDLLAESFNGRRPLRVVWDAGNGAAGDVITHLCRRLPGQHITLNTKVDGHFPAHHPDPTVPQYMAQLIDAVVKTNAEIGLAFDGDGDRLGIVDNNGRMWLGDELLTFFAGDMLKQQPGCTIVADVKTSQMLFDRVREQGGKGEMCKTGHSLLKARMTETQALLGGDISGHYCFADRYYGYDDGLYAAIRLLDILTRMPKDLATWRLSLPQWHNVPEIRVPCEESEKIPVIKAVKQTLKARKISFSEMDGVRVSFPYGWWLLRPSNTESAFSLRYEARTPENLTELREDLYKLLAPFGIKF